MPAPAKTIIKAKGDSKNANAAVKRAAPGAKPTKLPRTASKGADAGAAAAATPSQSKPKRDNFNDDFILPVKEYVKPARQLHLSEDELAEETVCNLSAVNPLAPSNITRYIPRERVFKLDPGLDHILLQYASEGWLKVAERKPSRRASQEAAAAAAAAAPAPAEAVARDEGTDSAASEPHLRNQFNYNDRATQTPVFPPRERATMTEPPPRADAEGETSAWRIHDAYLGDQERQRMAEEAAKAKNAAAKRGAASSAAAEGNSLITQAAAPAPAEESTGRLPGGPGMRRCLKLLERMAAQNTQREIVMDFRYWDDPADTIREHEGTLLPLWAFHARLGRGRHVTALAWSPAHPDLFAAGSGSFDAARQGAGAVVCFSLKSPATPEFEHATRSGVMCLDFHPTHAHLLAVGLHNGSVLVLSVHRAAPQPAASTGAEAGKHADMVAAVRWAPGESVGLRGLAIYSASADGHICHLTLAESALVRQDFMRLHEGVDEAGADSTDNLSGAESVGATCIDFCRDPDHLFLVGSEDGRLRKCSTAYNSQALLAYDGHAGAVYAVQWNGCHPATFLSASADWTVKLWHSNRPRAVMTLDVGCPVGDAAWAPYSSTVLAAACEDGRLMVWDLAHHTSEPLSKQKIVGKAGLTRIAFNAAHPVILVGDDRGCVHCLKLSPNLRKAALTAEGKRAAGLDAARLDAIFEIALKSDIL